MHPLVLIVGTIELIHGIVGFSWAAWGYRIIRRAHPNESSISWRTIAAITWMTFSGVGIVFILSVLIGVVRIGW